VHGVNGRTAKLDAGVTDYRPADVGDKHGRVRLRDALLQKRDRPRLWRLLKRVGAAVRVKRVNLGVQQAYRLVVGNRRFADDQVGRILNELPPACGRPSGFIGTELLARRADDLDAGKFEQSSVLRRVTRGRARAVDRPDATTEAPSGARWAASAQK
jgi:hypothetical protein